MVQFHKSCYLGKLCPSCYEFCVVYILSKIMTISVVVNCSNAGCKPWLEAGEAGY